MGGEIFGDGSSLCITVPGENPGIVCVSSVHYSSRTQFRQPVLAYDHCYQRDPTTVNLEIFAVNIFSCMAKDAKIKNTK